MSWHRHHNDAEPSSSLYLIAAPESAVVSLDDMKEHLRVDADNTDDDDVIDAFTAATTQHLDGRDGLLGRALIDQTWELRLSWFPCYGLLRLPLPPLIEVVSVKYIDADGAEQIFDSDNYHVTGIGDRGWLHLGSGKAWPVLGVGWPEPAIIRFRAGYVDTTVSPEIDAVPDPIIAAIKLLTANLYENRQTIVLGQSAIQLPWAAEALLAPYRDYTR